MYSLSRPSTELQTNRATKLYVRGVGVGEPVCSVRAHDDVGPMGLQ